MARMHACQNRTSQCPTRASTNQSSSGVWPLRVRKFVSLTSSKTNGALAAEKTALTAEEAALAAENAKLIGENAALTGSLI